MSTCRLPQSTEIFLYESIAKIIEENKDKSAKYIAQAIVNFIDSHFWIE